MSANILRSQYRSNELKNAAKECVSTNKENMQVQKGNSVAKDKNGCKSNKGLSLKTKYSLPNSTTQMQKSFLGETKFKIHNDNEEHSRSRPRVRKDISHTAISYRTRSSSNCRNRVSSDKKDNINSKLFQRSRSESRNIPPQNAQCVRRVLSHAHIPKTRHLSAEVKRRTFTSIEMWKDKMRKPYTGTVPKNLAGKYPNVLNVDQIHTKIKQRKSSIAEPTKILFQRSSNLQSEIDRKQNQNIKDSTFSWGTVMKCLPSEDVPNLTNEIAKNDEQNYRLNIRFGANIPRTSITPLDSSLLPLITPTKVRYLKREEAHYNGKLSIKKEVPEDIYPYEYDYLEDVPHMEREREDNAPKLSFRFLKQSVNADQRRIIVGYLIRLGVHCQYSSNIIYQTVKLFDITIDRILVETDNIQLMALACLWITLKRELTSYKIPSATTIVKMAKDLYINQEKSLLIYEKKIISAVKFNFRFADPYSLLFYYILDVTLDKKCNINSSDIPCIYFCGSYLLDISMLDENLCDRSVCVLAIAAAELSLYSVYSDNTNMHKWCKLRRRKYSLTECEEMAMSFTKQSIIQQAVESDKFGSNIVYKKYLRTKHGRVSNFLLDKMKKAFIPRDTNKL
ncbi:G2/mitotic-specific cyclin-1 [Formica fusca]